MVRFRRHCWEDYSIVVRDSIMISAIRTVHCVFSTHEYSPRLVFSNSQQNNCVFEVCLLEAPLGPLWRRHLSTFNARGCVVDSHPQNLFYRLMMVTNSVTVWNNLHSVAPLSKSKFKIGDVVRISKTRRVFKKGYLPQWSEEIFTLSKKLNTNPIT